MLILLGAQTMEHGNVEGKRELEQLLSGVAAGNREALAQLYDRARTAVYGVALSYLKNAHDAQDVTQDTFVRVWDCAAQYQPQGTPMAWVLTIARNLARMKLRQEGRQVGTEDRRFPRRIGRSFRTRWPRWEIRSGKWCCCMRSQA